MDALLIVTSIVAALLIGAIAGLIGGRAGRASCPQCGGRLTCPLHNPIAREVDRTGYPPLPPGIVLYNLGGYGLSGPGGPHVPR